MRIKISVKFLVVLPQELDYKQQSHTDIQYCIIDIA